MFHRTQHTRTGFQKVFYTLCHFYIMVFSQCVTSALFLGNMLRARKYRFTLCFRVLCDQYVERSAYANFFKFNRENKRCERAKVIADVSTAFWSSCWSYSDGLLHSVSILYTIIFSDTLCRITRIRNITHPRNFSAFFFLFITLLRYLVS